VQWLLLVEMLFAILGRYFPSRHSSCCIQSMKRKKTFNWCAAREYATLFGLLSKSALADSLPNSYRSLFSFVF
jgi:hypothetical protein